MPDGWDNDTDSEELPTREFTPPDCNDDGVPDGHQVAIGWTDDENNNGIPDECETCCDLPGDANNIPPVNILDITYLINYLYKFGTPPVCGDCPNLE